MNAPTPFDWTKDSAATRTVPAALVVFGVDMRAAAHQDGDRVLVEM